MSELELLRPFTLHDLQLQNRVVMAPLTRSRSDPDRVPKPVMAEYYRQRASAGLIITEATAISPQAVGWNETPGIYTDEMEAAWRSIVEGVHRSGGKIFLQLWHTGRASHSDFHNGDLPVSASAIKIEGDGTYTPQGKKPYETPRPLEMAELPGVVEDYANAAKRAMNAGFDGVEVHSANGYLLDQFLQSKTNHRTDEYGGSVENRARLLMEVVRRITEMVPANRVGVRISPNGTFNDMGSPDFREQFSYVAKQLDTVDLAYLHVLDGTIDGVEKFSHHGHGPSLTLADFRNWFHGPLMGNCGYTKESAEERIAAGDADLVAFGRPFISNPDLVARFANDLPLTEMADPSVWYSPTGAKGYTDFPAASAQFA